MPYQKKIQDELEALLSRPQYSSMLHHRNEFKKPTNDDETAAGIAARTAKTLVDKHPLMDPIEVLELKGPVELYRTHDGGAGTRLGKSGRYNQTAGTLGGSWVERSIVETIWSATKDRPDARLMFMEFMRTANFVLPEWNSMLYIVCMTVPSGHSVVVVRGRGSWKAMKTPVGESRPGAAPVIHTPADVLKNKMVPLPGLVQCLLPLYSDLWIQPVDQNSAKWPLST